MANELRINYQGSGAPYAIIRRKSDWTVWNGSSFESWLDANITTYDVTLTSRSGDVYSADFPAAIAAGDYRIVYYESLAGSFTTSDLILKSRDLYWNGEAASESEVSLSPYALTTVEAVKRYMGITSDADDTRIADLINLVSAMVEHVTGRAFKARDYRLRTGGRREKKLVLRHFPVQHINRVGYGQAEAMSVSYSGAAIRANVAVYADPEAADGGGIRLVTVNSSGVRTANNLAFNSYPSLSLMEAAIEAISGWTATVVANIPSADLYVTGSEDARTRSVKLYYPDEDESSYSLNQRTGILAFDRQDWVWNDSCCNGNFTGRHQGLLIEYRAGFETIPADVDLLARDLVKEAYFAGKLNTSVRGYSLGPYRVDFRDDPTSMIRARLGSYLDAAAMVGGG